MNTNTTFYIYHLPEFIHPNGRIGKIGCTINLHDRIRSQGSSNYEILEEHIDIYEVSDREIELQREYGYPIDRIPYWKTVQHSTAHNLTKEHSAKGGSVSSTWSRKLTFEQAEEIRFKAKNGYTRRMLAKEYNMSVGSINQIVNNLTYVDA